MRVAHAAMFLCNVLPRNVRPVHRAALRAALPQAIQVLHAWGHDVSHCMALNNMLMPIKSATHPQHHSAFCVCQGMDHLSWSLKSTAAALGNCIDMARAMGARPHCSWYARHDSALSDHVWKQRGNAL